MRSLAVRSGRSRLGAAGGTEGFVVFGALLFIVGSITAMVLIGAVMNRRYEPPPADPVPREVRYAAEPLEIRFGAIVTRRLDAGDPLFVRCRGDGEAAVFESAHSNRIIGFTEESRLRTEPLLQGRARGSLRSLQLRAS
jgi:hypothetical protein